MTLSEIKALEENEGHWDALTMASEAQCEQLIDEGFWEEDDFSRQQEAHEDMRCLMAEAAREFG